MRKFAIIFTLYLLSVGCKTYIRSVGSTTNDISPTIDAWHKAAAEARLDDYFALMTDNSVFIGTDATENWGRDAFYTFSKPFFDRGTAWTMTPLQRNIFVSEDGKTAWFDELLDSSMKLCRGSGVLQKVDGKWKIAHYVLSATIPNDSMDQVIEIKKEFDDNLKKKLGQE
jgi:ketosteroid isomerase-like protein